MNFFVILTVDGKEHYNLYPEQEIIILNNETIYFS
jgi:hypothetical protein